MKKCLKLVISKNLHHVYRHFQLHTAHSLRLFIVWQLVPTSYVGHLWASYTRIGILTETWYRDLGTTCQTVNDGKQCVVYVRKTNKMHPFLNNLFHLIYPLRVSNK